MAIGRITGPMLFSNLERQGVNLAIDGNLVYADVTGRYVGINNSNPGFDLDVPGNVRLATLTILNDTITSNTGSIKLGSTANIKITGGTQYDVLYTDGSGNLAFGNLNVISGMDGFTGNNISLGTNTYGNLSNAIVFSESTTLTDAIAELNRLLGNITDSIGTTIHVSGNITGANITGTTIYGNIVSPTINAINANVTAANIAISTLQSNIGAYETWANLEIASTNSNVASFGTYSNANAVTQAVSINSLATGANANTAAYLTTYSGNISAGNITSTFYGNVHTDYIFSQTANVVTIIGTGSLQVPVGTTAEQPIGHNGMLRFNTDIPALEYFDGTVWVPVTNTVTDQQITPTGSDDTYTLDQDANTVGIIVSINGTLQKPYTAYNVHDSNQITFSQIPLATDLIDIRFLGAAVTINNTLADDLSVQGNISLTGILTAPQTTKASNAPGLVGQVCWDSNYIYVCTAPNTWKRSQLTGGY